MACFHHHGCRAAAFDTGKVDLTKLVKETSYLQALNIERVLRCYCFLGSYRALQALQGVDPLQALQGS